MTNYYKKNKNKELQTQYYITNGLNIYINNNYDVLSINHILTDDYELQQRGVDRIISITTNAYESIAITVDDKAQNTDLLSTGLVLPYLREYTTGYTQFDYTANAYKLNQLIAIYCIKSQHLILLDHTLLAHTLLDNDNYLLYADIYGFNNETNEYYTFYNSVDSRDKYKSYSYLQYYYKLTVSDLLTDELFFNAIIDIISLTTNESILQSLIDTYL